MVVNKVLYSAFGLNQIDEGASSSSQRTGRKWNVLTKTIGCIPLIGTVVGVARLTFTHHVKQTHACTPRETKILQEQINCGIFETLSLGLIWAIVSLFKKAFSKEKTPETIEKPIKSLPPTIQLKKVDRLGTGKGFHGRDNSCSIASLLFAYFGEGTHFDSLLEIKDHNPIRERLKGIIDQYRNEGYVPAEPIQALREALLPSTPKDSTLELNEVLPALLAALEPEEKDYTLSTDSYIFVPENKQGTQNVQRILTAMEQERETLGQPKLQCGNHLLIYLPTSFEERRPLGQVLPNKTIQVAGEKGEPIKMKLASVICMGSYDPAYSRSPGYGHFVSYTFDENGDGYYFDSMVGQEGEKEHQPEVHRLDQLLNRIQMLEPAVPDYLKDKDPQKLCQRDIAAGDLDPRRIQYNLKACLYVRD